MIVSASSTARALPPTPPPVFLALGARCACVPYTPAFRGFDIRVVRPLSVREKPAMRDAICLLVRAGEARRRVIVAEAGGLRGMGDVELELCGLLSVLMELIFCVDWPTLCEFWGVRTRA